MQVSTQHSQGYGDSALSRQAATTGRWLTVVETATAEAPRPKKARPHRARPLTAGDARTLSPVRDPRLVRTARAATLYEGRQCLAETAASAEGAVLDICA